jgi:DNA-directed RNA polymerase specialized sigma subunit
MQVQKPRKFDDLLSDLTPSLRKLIRTPLRLAGPDVTAAIERYSRDGNAADFDRVFAHFAPIALIESIRLKRLHESVFIEPIAEYISDALLGLVKTIQQYNQRHKGFSFGSFCYGVKRDVGRQIWHGFYERRPAGSKTRALRTLARIRSDLTRELGRVPTREELAGRLAGKLTNPQIHFARFSDRSHQVLAPSQEDEEFNQRLENVADARASDPAKAVLDREAIGVALKGLKGDDRKILRLLLQGLNPSQIAERVGLNRRNVLNRCNGVLWESRCRAELAAYVGVQPDAAPPAKNSHSYFPTFNPTPSKLAIGIHERTTPARLAAG